MQKFYTVREGSPLWDAYETHEKNAKALGKLFAEFSKQNGIQSNQVYITCNRLAFVPTQEDEEKFSKDFMVGKPGEFKKSSRLSKAWVSLCKENGIEKVSEPFVPFYFNGVVGPCRYRLFKVGDTLFCTFTCNSNFTAPDYFEEMKASEFYSVMEGNNIEL